MNCVLRAYEGNYTSLRVGLKEMELYPGSWPGRLLRQLWVLSTEEMQQGSQAASCFVTVNKVILKCLWSDKLRGANITGESKVESLIQPERTPYSQDRKGQHERTDVRIPSRAQTSILVTMVYCSLTSGQGKSPQESHRSDRWVRSLDTTCQRKKELHLNKKHLSQK